FLRLPRMRFAERPCKKLVGDTAALPWLQHVKLAKLCRRSGRIDGERERTDLGKCPRRAFRLGEADLERRIRQLLLPPCFIQLREKMGQVAGRIEMAERLDERLLEQFR